MPFAVLVRAGACGRDSAAGNIQDPGPHGCRVLYKFASAGNNNGSAFAGEHREQLVHDHRGHHDAHWALPHIIPALAIGGSFARKDRVPESAGRSPLLHRCSPACCRGGLSSPGSRSSRRSRSAPSSSTSFAVLLSSMTADAPPPTTWPRRPAPVRTMHVRCRRGHPAPAPGDSFVKIDPRHLTKNPVMFIVEVGSVLRTVLYLRDLGGDHRVENSVRRARRVFSGSRSSSPTSPRPWPRVGARPRPHAAGDAPRDDGRGTPTAVSMRSPVQLDR